MFSEERLLEISGEFNFPFLIQNDSQLTSSLKKVVEEKSAKSFKICYRFSVIPMPEHLYLECVEIASILIEEILEPDIYVNEAFKSMEVLVGEELLNTPLWFYLARSQVSEHKKFQNLLIRHFGKHPAYFAEVMEKTGKDIFIPTLEEYLLAITPYTKFLPLAEDSHEVFYPHDVWLRVGAAYVRLLKSEGSYPEEQPSVLDFLETKFFKMIPEDKDQWIQTLSEDFRRQYIKFEQIYWENFEYV